MSLSQNNCAPAPKNCFLESVNCDPHINIQFPKTAGLTYGMTKEQVVRINKITQQILMKDKNSYKFRL